MVQIKGMRLNNRTKENLAAYLMIAPTLIAFLIFLYIPFVNAVRISFYEYNGFGNLVDFVGFDNFTQTLVDSKFWGAFLNTFWLMAAAIVVAIPIGFFLAYVLYIGVPGKKLFNTALFIPYLISMVVVGSIWRIIYNPTLGPINQLLDFVGLKTWGYPWLALPETSLGAIAITWIWRSIPFDMLIMYANIVKMPDSFIEAADIDGATTWQKIRYVIIPYLASSFNVLFILTVTSTLRIFDLVWVMTRGGPGGATEVITSYIYRKAFVTMEFGPGTAASVIVMIVMVGIMFLVTSIRSIRNRGNA